MRRSISIEIETWRRKGLKSVFACESSCLSCLSSTPRGSGTVVGLADEIAVNFTFAHFGICAFALHWNADR